MSTLQTLAFSCALAVAGSAFADAPAPPIELSAQRKQEILRDALQNFDDGVALARANPAEAERRFRLAAGGFQALRDSGVRNAALEFNLGNTYMRLNETGRAIVQYLRAERLAPTDKRIEANLRYARQQVTSAIAPTGQSRLIRSLLFWQHVTTQRQKLWAAGVLSAVGCALLALRLRWRAAPLVTAGVVCVAVAFANAGLLLWERHVQVSTPTAVVVAATASPQLDQADARGTAGRAGPAMHGPGDTSSGERSPAVAVLQGPPVLRTGAGVQYEPKMSEPLSPGVELRIISERGAWAEVELRDQRTGWIPLAVLERV